MRLSILSVILPNTGFVAAMVRTWIAKNMPVSYAVTPIEESITGRNVSNAPYAKYVAISASAVPRNLGFEKNVRKLWRNTENGRRFKENDGFLMEEQGHDENRNGSQDSDKVNDPEFYEPRIKHKI
jgi:hypothetical protein